MGLGGYYGHYQVRTPYSLLLTTPTCTYHAHHAHHVRHVRHAHHTHYQGHWLSATAFLVNATGNATVAAAAERVVEVYASVMEAWRARYGDATTAPCHTNTLLPRPTPLVTRHTPLVTPRLLSGTATRRTATSSLTIRSCGTSYSLATERRPTTRCLSTRL